MDLEAAAEPPIGAAGLTAGGGEVDGASTPRCSSSRFMVETASFFFSSITGLQVFGRLTRHCAPGRKVRESDKVE